MSSIYSNLNADKHGQNRHLMTMSLRGIHPKQPIIYKKPAAKHTTGLHIKEEKISYTVLAFATTHCS
jgi:hypothetical protein